MSMILKNSLALVIGLLVGGLVNIGLIMLGSALVPPPAGVDATNMESLKAGMHLFEFKHFVFPFLAHALGTLVGAVVAARMAVSHKLRFALAVGVLFLAGGITNVILLPSPLWFNVIDLVFAYIPMGWLGYTLCVRIQSPTVAS